jgi:hypothetical protein
MQTLQVQQQLPCEPEGACEGGAREQPGQVGREAQQHQAALHLPVLRGAGGGQDGAGCSEPSPEGAAREGGDSWPRGHTLPHPAVLRPHVRGEEDTGAGQAEGGRQDYEGSKRESAFKARRKR